MKKILSIALAFIFVFALAVPAFAADVELKQENIAVDGAYVDQTGNATVTYNVFGNYIVTVPDAIALTAASVDAPAVSESMTVNATQVLIPYGDELQVSVGGDFKIVYNNGTAPEDTTNEDEVSFKITANAVDITAASNAATKVILTVNEDGINDGDHGSGSADGSVSFTVTTLDKPKYNESYTGTITFTTSVVDA